MPFNKTILSILICLTSLSSQLAFANDSSFADDNGSITLKYQPDISMDKESLFLSENSIQVDYIFRNTSQKDLMVPIAFPMPPMYFGDSDHSEIEDFKLWVNGQPQKTKHKLVVLLDNQVDISEKIAKLGWSVDEVVEFVDSGQIPKGKKPLPAQWFDKDKQPRFTMSNYFIWQQNFPAGKPVSIRHTYKPSISTGIPLPANIIIEDYTKETCLDQSAQAAIKKRTSGYGVNWANLRYILVTANNWQGVIKDFKLTIKKQKPSDLISLCFDGELKKTDALTFEFRQENFKPKHDLSVLFVRKDE